MSFTAFSQGVSKHIPIEGKWLMVNNNGGLCNVCPKFEFNHNGLGSIKFPNSETLSFIWQLNDSSINFIFNEGKYFPIDTFYVNINTLDSRETLILSSEIDARPINYDVIIDDGTYTINVSSWIYELVRLRETKKTN